MSEPIASLYFLASDAVIDAAYAWLCRQRRDWPADTGIWDLRFRWCRDKQRIQAVLQRGDYPFSPMSRVTKSNGEVVHVWSSRDALVLKVLAIVLAKNPSRLRALYACERVWRREGGGAGRAGASWAERLRRARRREGVLQQHRPASHAGTPRGPRQRPPDREAAVAGHAVQRDLRRACIGMQLAAVDLEKHPDKTFVGRIDKGFDFLGYRFDGAGMTVARATVERFVEHATRLYEQERRAPHGPALLGPYVRRWTGWVRGGAKPCLASVP